MYDAGTARIKIEGEVESIKESIRSSFPLKNLDLPDRFFPAHLTVALIDAMFHPSRENGAHVVPAAPTYCRRFGIRRVRADRMAPPPVGEQEAPQDLIRRYDALGVDGMIVEAFGIDTPPSAKTRRSAARVLGAAKALSSAGISVLQDLWTQSPARIERLLRYSAKVDRSSAREFLMYAGGDDFVHGEGKVKLFVSVALGKRRIGTTQAERLVRQSAYELILAPRYLDYLIWNQRPKLTTVTDSFPAPLGCVKSGADSCGSGMGRAVPHPQGSSPA